MSLCDDDVPVTETQDVRRCVLKNDAKIEVRNRQINGHNIREIREAGGLWVPLAHRGSGFDWDNDGEAIASWIKDRFGLDYSADEKSALVAQLGRSAPAHPLAEKMHRLITQLNISDNPEPPRTYEKSKGRGRGYDR